LPISKFVYHAPEITWLISALKCDWWQAYKNLWNVLRKLLN
jgi:hypothetical protein